MTDTAHHTPAMALDDEQAGPVLAEARGWLHDCGYDEDMVDGLTDAEVVRLVDHEYDGGWPAFLTAIEPLVPTGGEDATGARRAAEWATLVAKAAALGVLGTTNTEVSAR